MISTSQLSADLSAMISDLPGKLKIGELEIDAGFSSLNRAERMTMTGDIEALDFRVVFPVSALGEVAHPKTGDKVIATPPGLLAGNCRVGAVIYPQGGVSIILELAIDRRNPFPVPEPDPVP
jgi:hypothetical protein